MAFVNGLWAARKEDAWTTLSYFMISIYSGWSRNILLISIRNVRIRELANVSPLSTISLKKTQKGELGPKLSSGGYITIIPVLPICNNPSSIFYLRFGISCSVRIGS